MSFLGEIRRRKIFQVAAVYAVVAWLLIQIVATIEEPLNLPEWVDTFVIVLLAVGFPVTLIISWAFNLTPEGVVREGGGKDVVSKSGLKVEYLLFGVIAIALFWLVYRVEFDRPKERLEATAIDEQLTADAVAEAPPGVLPNSIAVLPFENLSPDPDNAFFAAGIHESTLNQLQKIRDLTVIARTSVLQFENDPPAVPDIAAALNVGMVMEGSVRYANGRVLITAQLIDGKTGGHLWSDEYNRELADVFTVQADVAKHIATAMEAQLLPKERARIENRPTESEEAYQHYLHALSYPDMLAYPEYIPARIEALEKAISLDPIFAEAYVELFRAHDSARDRERALKYARKAIDLDPTAAHAWAGVRWILRYYHKKIEESRAAGQRAIELGSGDPEIVRGHAIWLADVEGKFEEAIRYGERSVAIDPQDSEGHGWLGYLYMRTGRYANAKRSLQEAIRLHPSRPAHHWMLANVEYLSGDWTAAKSNLDNAFQITTHIGTDRLGYMAYLYGLLGQTDLAAEAVNRLDESSNPVRGSFGYLRWAALGTRDKEQALLAWDEVISGYLEEDKPVSPGTISRFRDNWLNDPMLEEPKFVELRKRLGYEG